MSNKAYHHGDLKTALIEAGIALLENKGVEALSLRTLASEVGVSHMAPYAHFKNKSELFQAIAAHGFSELSRRLNQVDPSLKAQARILEYGARYIEFAINNAPLYRLMLSQTQITGPEEINDKRSHMSSALQEASKEPFVILRAAFAEIFEDKEIQHIRAHGAWSLVHGMSALMIDGQLTVPEGMSIKDFLAVASVQMPLKTRS